MLKTEEEWLGVIDDFQAAAVGNGCWLDALSGLARATGSRAGELIGLGSEHAVPFNWVTDVGQDWINDFIAVGGGNPARNPFVREGSKLAELQVAASYDFVTPEERRRLPFLNEFAASHDTPYICLSPLLKKDNMLIGLAVMRSASQGEITDKERAIFASLAPHVRSAVRTQLALEHQGATLVAGALEALSMPVFLCDGRGFVQAMTPLAEQLLAPGSALSLVRGLLVAENSSDTSRLQEAIQTVVGRLSAPGSPVARTVILHGSQGLPLVLEVLPMPRREHAFVFDARVLVVARVKPRAIQHRKQLLMQLYRLTDTEAEIALHLAQGYSPQQIAGSRNTSVGTVRVQVKSVYAKMGLSRQCELMAFLGQF